MNSLNRKRDEPGGLHSCEHLLINLNCARFCASLVVGLGTRRAGAQYDTTACFLLPSILPCIGAGTWEGPLAC